MGVEKNHASPLAPALDRYRSVEESATIESNNLRWRRNIKCLGVFTAFILLHIVIFAVLALTVFRFKDPELKLNSVSIQSMNYVPGSSPSSNTTLTAEIAVKNQNWGEFRFDNSPITFSCWGTTVGEASIPHGRVKIRSTKMVSVTLAMNWDRIWGVPNLGSEISSGILTLSSETRLNGKVKLMMIIKGSRTGKMKCTIKINLTTREIQDLMNCN